MNTCFGVFVAVLPLLVQKIPLSCNKLHMLVNCDPCSSFRSSQENNIIELCFWVLKNYSLSFGNTKFRNVRMPTYYFLQYIKLLLIRNIWTEHLWFSFRTYGLEIRASLTLCKSAILGYNNIGIFVSPNSHKSWKRANTFIIICT